jgi:hypothetical protein
MDLGYKEVYEVVAYLTSIGYPGLLLEVALQYV